LTAFVLFWPFFPLCPFWSVLPVFEDLAHFTPFSNPTHKYTPSHPQHQNNPPSEIPIILSILSILFIILILLINHNPSNPCSIMQIRVFSCKTVFNRAIPNFPAKPGLIVQFPGSSFAPQAYQRPTYSQHSSFQMHRDSLNNTSTTYN
jgi:hypothetical protein